MEDALPLHTQEAFLAHVSGLRRNRQLFGRVAKTDPEQLLVITKHVWPKPIPAITVTRTYFGLVPNNKSPEFRELAEAQFIISRGQCHPVELTLWGEPPKDTRLNPRSRDMIHLAFWQRYREQHSPTCLGASIYGHHLALRYDGTGSLKEVDPLANDRTPAGRFEGWPNLLQMAGSLATLKEKGAVRIRINRHYSYLLSFDPQWVTVEKFSRQQPADKLVAPSSINPEEIASRLFHPETIDDPVNTPPQLDRSWRSANILYTLGINWLRN